MRTENWISVNGERILVTHHALQRLDERWPDPCGKPKNPLQTIEKMLSQAVPVVLTRDQRVRRLLNSRCVPADYLAHSGMRFVIITEDEIKRLVTVEKIIR